MQNGEDLELIFKFWEENLWLGWPCLTKKIQPKKPRSSTPPSKSVLP
jgi:hypothetical protein